MGEFCQVLLIEGAGFEQRSESSENKK